MVKTKTRELRERASNFMDAHKPEEAERALHEALQSHPNNLDLMSMLGIVQTRLDKEEEAESTFRLVLARDPYHEEAACSLGRILDNSLRTEEAEMLYRGVLEKRPDSHCALDDYCRLLLSEHREDEALKIARDHVERHPDSVEAYNGLRYVLAKKEDRLEGMLEAAEPESALVNELLRTMLEQLETVQAVFNSVDINTVSESTLTDLEEEQIRLRIEISHLRTQMIEKGHAIDPDLEFKINSVPQDS